jgi:hypothetical protein
MYFHPVIIIIIITSEPIENKKGEEMTRVLNILTHLIWTQKIYPLFYGAIGASVTFLCIALLYKPEKQSCQPSLQIFDVDCILTSSN